MSNLESVVKRLEAVAVKLEATAASQGSKGSAVTTENNEFVEAFDEIIRKHLAKLLHLTDTIGSPELKEQMKIVSDAFAEERKFLVIASRHGAPTAADLTVLLKPLSETITKVQDFREKHRKSKQFNHLSSLSEFIPVLGWVGGLPKPVQYIQQVSEGADFYSNKIKMEFKATDQNHFNWASALKPIVEALKQYCTNYHPMGVAWNVNAPKATAASGGGAPAGGAPPPPPPAAAPAPSAAKATKGPDMDQLFSSLNKGANITSGLKKVDPSMQTHKNPNLRAGAKVPGTAPTSSKAKQTATVKSSAPAKPVFQKVNKKWAIEHQVGNKEIVISDCSMKETIYVYKCVDSVIQVKSKINSITLDSCKKTGVVFEDVLSTCEFINCQSVQAQANGNVPTISIDKTDGCQVYLNSKNCNADIVSAKSSEMNIIIVKGDGDQVEFPVPEQFKTKYNGKSFTTQALDINL